MRAVIAALLLCALPAAADAQDAMVLSLGGDAPEEVAAQARSAVAIALQQDGLSLLSEADLAMRVPPSRLAECHATACAWAISVDLGVSMVAGVTTWATEGHAASVTVSLIVGTERAYTASANVTGDNLLAAARAAVTEAQNARGRALIIEGTATPDTHVETPDEAEIDESQQGTATDALHAERPLEEWILPSILGVVGLGLVGLSVYAMLDQDCQQFGATTGDCLRGSDPNYGLGVTMAVVGALSLVGAVVWLVVGGTPASQGDIDVVMDARGVGVRF